MRPWVRIQVVILRGKKQPQWQHDKNTSTPSTSTAVTTTVKNSSTTATVTTRRATPTPTTKISNVVSNGNFFGPKRSQPKKINR